MNGPRIIVALDCADAGTARARLAKLDPSACRIKIGKELFTATGPSLVEECIESGFSVFLDLKFHDIPNTVAKACAAAARLGVWMVNVHALGGRRMMEAARAELETFAPRPRLIAVTVLTSLEDNELLEVGLPGSTRENVLRLAALARECGLDGVVCSAHEAVALRAALGPDFLLVTPGIRPAGAAQDDQRRIVTPADAVAMGSNYLVIGRPVTHAADPGAVLREINAQITARWQPV